MTKNIGLLFSLSGTVSVVGEGQLQAALLAIEEVNQNTNLTFNPIIRDARSDPNAAAKEAYSLLSAANTDVLLGCYMSSVRNSVASALNETAGLLLYPTLYEGEEVHPNIFFLGAVPNQQVEPLLCWTFHNISSNFVLVGSDYVYPRSTNQQVRRWVENGGGTVLLEEYFPLGCTKFERFFISLKRLTKQHPSLVVFSTMVGDSVPAYYREFKRKGFSFPIVSPLTSEREISLMSGEVSSGHICSSPYFQSLDTASNRTFLGAIRRKFGDLPVSREMMTTYGAVHLLSHAYKLAEGLPLGSNEAEKVRMVLKDLRFQGPQGKMNMDPATQHLWQWCHIGRINREGGVDVIWSSPGPIPPRHVKASPEIAISIRADEQEEHACSSPVGINHRFRECLRMTKIAAGTSSNVLITGETGTGKELLAKCIHANSSRADKPFIAINCAGIPRDLVESELFGYDEGAFTGARPKGKPGKLELCNEGTLFLDEIGDMPKDLQAHLLRVMEDKQIYRVGGTRTIRLDIRFIAASNKDLRREIGDGGCFRHDLFYRLSVFHIHVPRLCERPEDISALAEHFLENCNSRTGGGKRFHPATLRLLAQYEWPGNVRELANVIERSFHFSQDSAQICPGHLPEHVTSQGKCHGEVDGMEMAGEPSAPGTGFEFPECQPTSKGPSIPKSPDVLGSYSRQIRQLKDVEEELIKQALTESRYNLSKAARQLGIGRSTLYRKLKKYNVAVHPD